MQLGHATFVTADLDSARRFFVDIVGLIEGARPPFSVDGYWLNASGRPVVHLIAAPASGAAGRVMPRIDHIAFRLDSAGEWQALLERRAEPFNPNPDPTSFPERKNAHAITRARD
ncbi:VOC family protein [Paraburkholderia sp. UCT2]|uniref:VOC family protein n=1 Tax=Paraburkholderia sp. UCT2 TaxID=2615208 RepID=UPI001654F9BB|nr:VOC family protein [Paraburkholderia sp. UCT2]MBC8728590.1 hypothetical protein [Paraburkholderia sp. UCT2]